MSLSPPRTVSRFIILAGLVIVSIAPTGTGSTIMRDGPALAGSGRAAEATSQFWLWPVTGPRRVVRTYQAPPTPYAAGHRGIDIAVGVGGVVRAPEEGVVHFAGMVAGRPVVSLRHDGGLISSVEPVESTLKAGDVVARGDPIGTLWAETSHCPASCLHLGVRRHGEYVSPLNYLGGIPRSVLLPPRPVA
ncbi:M23 family metallopeptidase [Salinibacterium sp. SYSU T00001]|uniref:murein hydrolase activator EnvC family protein n=1 Tax=Homoserinimonas sedimenticola TaxID=2986805 RepID=UPI002235FCA9|nr:M23 family metallopeptidase [Salinibacterium sedimenticola]MCW4384839.1 M23 family metallopeptidase [Salinibacterium sedimenticola]